MPAVVSQPVLRSVEVSASHVAEARTAREAASLGKATLRLYAGPTTGVQLGSLAAAMPRRWRRKTQSDRQASRGPNRPATKEDSLLVATRAGGVLSSPNLCVKSSGWKSVGMPYDALYTPATFARARIVVLQASAQPVLATDEQSELNGWQTAG